jgi:hypothetical protein
VNVVFDQPAQVGGVYAAGKPRGQTVPNHVRATVRVGPSRPKEMFDQVALQIEKRWNEVVSDAALGAKSFGSLPPAQEKQFKKLQGFVFVPMVAAIENGVAAPGVCLPS